MKPVKVLHITQSAGGVETYLKQIFAAINHEAFEFVLVGTVSQSLEKCCIENNVRFVRIKMSRGVNPVGDIVSVFRLRSIIKKEKPALVHLHSAKAGFAGRMACRWAGVPSLYSPHSLSYAPFSGMKRIVFLSLETWAKKFTHKLHAVSYTEANKLIYEIGHQQEKTTVILNALAIKEKENVIEKGLHQLQAPLKVGTIGRLTSSKNPLLFVQVAASVIQHMGKQVHFYFLGIGEHDELQPQVEEAIKQFGIEENVHLLQRGDLVTSRSFLQQLNVFLLTSICEGLSYALLEAMHEGVPCVVSKVEGNIDVIQHGENGYTCLTVDEYTYYIAKLLNDKTLALQLGAAARNYVIKHHNISQTILQLEKLYYQISNSS